LIKRPKLYFYDSGLVARLLGIRSPEELRHHPLRGNLFESWVVGEVYKWRFHNRQPLPIHFWREHKGREIDLLIDVGNKVVAVEVKAGATVNSDFFRDLEYYRSLVSGYLKASFLVYGGDQQQTRLKNLVIPWTNITRLMESLVAK
jgi:predicted AAA+ superfamily ATPase